MFMLKFMFQSGMNVDIGVEGVWAMRANSAPANPHSGPNAPKNTPPFPPMPHPPLTHPPPPYVSSIILHLRHD